MMTRLMLFLAAVLTAGGAPLSDHAAEYRVQLSRQILPYWLQAVDGTNGGYLLSDDAVKGRGMPKEKALVTQARMVWTFAHVHRKGFDDANGKYLAAAKSGYRFLVEKFHDPQQGGYFWKTDLAGKPSNDRKILYGESFVLYAFVEYYRASGDTEALVKAMDLFRIIQQRAHDDANGGWTEHFTRDWKPLAPRDPAGEVEVAGLKSANTHLHLMEALAELADASPDAAVRKSLAEALRINMQYFYPKEAGKSCFHRQPDWKAVTDPRSAGLSYGHNVEFAWLMVRAQNVLGETPAWPHFYAHLLHALKYGYDHERGGLYHRGEDDRPATDTTKIWWVEAEMMAALTDALLFAENKDQRIALDKLVHFVNQHQADPRDGVWVDSVTADGKPKSTAKAHGWKANYHDVRALVKFIEGFQGR